MHARFINSMYYLIFALLMMGSAPAFAQEKIPESKLEDLFYKNTLFHYYSGDYISALTRILVNEKRSLVDTDKDRTKILQGGIYLAYGLDYDAKQVFEYLNKESLDEDLRNVIWFYLGRDFYDNFDYTNATESLEKITKDASYSNRSEKFNILSNSYVYTSQVNKLEKLANNDNLDEKDKVYVKFNLAIAYLRNNQPLKGKKLLDEISDIKVKNIIQSTISDKAKLHLANIAFNEKKYKESINYIDEMNADGLYSDNAIYLSALSHSILGNTRKAYSLLNTLKARESTSIYKYYSVLLIARILEKNGNYQQALNVLNDGLSSISVSKQDLHSLLDKVRKDFFLTGLSKTKDGEIIIANKQYKKLVDELIFSKRFASHYNNYIDLLKLRNNINYWKTQIPQLSIMLSERDRYFKEKKSKISTTRFIQSKADFAERLGSLKSQSLLAQKSEDARLLFSDTEMEYEDDLSYIDKKVKRLSRKEDLSDVQYKVRIMKGLNYWNAASDYKPRVWDVIAGIKESETELDTLNKRIISLQRAAGSEFNYTKYANNIKETNKRIDRLSHLLDSTIVRLKEKLILVASEELDERFKGIDAYYKAFKYDIARVSDRVFLENK